MFAMETKVLVLLLLGASWSASASSLVAFDDPSMLIGDFRWSNLNGGRIRLSFTTARTDLDWIGIGTTSSLGLGSSLMSGGPFGGAAVVGSDNGVAEYVLKGSSPVAVEPWAAQGPDSRELKLCISKQCLSPFQTCLANPNCAGLLRRALAASNTTMLATMRDGNQTFFDTYLACCSTPRGPSIFSQEDKLQATGSFLSVVACTLESCAPGIFGSVPVPNLESSVFNKTSSGVTLDFVLARRQISDLTIDGITTFILAGGGLSSDGSLEPHSASDRLYVVVDLETGKITTHPLPGYLLSHVAITIFATAALFPVALVLRMRSRRMTGSILFGASLVVLLAGCAVVGVSHEKADIRNAHAILGFLLIILIAIIYLFMIWSGDFRNPAPWILASSSKSLGGTTYEGNAAMLRSRLRGQYGRITSVVGYIVLMVLTVPVYEEGLAMLSHSAVAVPDALKAGVAVASFVTLSMACFVFYYGFRKRRVCETDSEPASSDKDLSGHAEKNSSHGKGEERKTRSSSEGESWTVEESIVPVVLTWEKVTVVAKTGKMQTEPRRILTHAIGYAAPRTLSALMGPSGSGKTTLLEIIAHRRPVPIDGSVKVNGVPGSVFSSIHRLIAFLPQTDHLHGYLTVRETLAFAARLILTKSSQDQLFTRVNDLVDQLELRHCLDTVVGGDYVKGLSGGEKKRVSIALQLLKNPSCLCLDEPTTGLDSQLAIKLIQLLRRLTNEGRTVIVSIHQPSETCFDLFDRVVLLSAGYTVLSGSKTEMLAFLECAGRGVPVNWNPAEWLLNITDFDLSADDPSRDVSDGVPAPVFTVEYKLNSTKPPVDVQVLKNALEAFYKDVNPAKLRDEPAIVSKLIQYARTYGLEALEKQFSGTYNTPFQNFLARAVSDQEAKDLEDGGEGLTGDRFATWQEVSDVIKRFAASKESMKLVADIQGSKEFALALISRLDDPTLRDAMTEIIEGRSKTALDALVYVEPATLLTQLKLLLERGFLLVWRNPQALKFQVIQMLVFGLLIGALFSQACFLDTGPFFKTVTMAIIVASVGFVTVSAGVQLAFDDRLVFEREIADGTYGPWPYFAHKVCIAVPLSVFISLAMIVPAYFWVGLNPDRASFLIFILINSLTVFAFDAVVVAVALVVDSLSSAYAIAVFYEGIGMFFSGVSIPAYAMPVYLRWIHYIGPFSYAYGAVIVNEFENTDDDFYIDITGVVFRDKWINIAILLGFGIFFRIVAWVAIRWRFDRIKRFGSGAIPNQD